MTLVSNGPSAMTLSTTLETNLIVGHAGLTVPPKLLTIDLASPTVSTIFSQLPTPLPAVTSSTASPWVATVVKLVPLGLGSTVLVLLPVVTSVIMNSASTTPWPSALITSLLQVSEAATILSRLIPNAKNLAK